MRSARVEIAKASLRTSAGILWILATERGLREIRLGKAEAPTRAEGRLRAISFVHRSRWTDSILDRLRRYFEGDERNLDLPLDLAVGTPFERRVWEAARRIPFGRTASYKELARRARAPRAARAVGNALGKNPVPIVIPCHRIVHADHSIGGFSSGLAWKRYLLEIERGQLAIHYPKRRRLFFR